MSAIGQVPHAGRVDLADLELLQDSLFYDRRDQRGAPLRFGVPLDSAVVRVIAGGASESP